MTRESSISTILSECLIHGHSFEFNKCTQVVKVTRDSHYHNNTQSRSRTILRNMSTNGIHVKVNNMVDGIDVSRSTNKSSFVLVRCLSTIDESTIHLIHLRIRGSTSY